MTDRPHRTAAVPSAPCPFCGGTKFCKQATLSGQVAVVCDTCGVRGPWSNDWDIAVFSWDVLPHEQAGNDRRNGKC